MKHEKADMALILATYPGFYCGFLLEFTTRVLHEPENLGNSDFFNPVSAVPVSLSQTIVIYISLI